MQDVRGREYAKLSQLKPGDLVQVDEGFEDCFTPWSVLPVVRDESGELGLVHNAPECGACGGHDEGDCIHSLEGQIMEDGDSLVGIYFHAQGDETHG